jgi:omega-amidase
MNLTGVQLDIAWEDKPANFAKVRSLLASAAVQGCSLIVLPEMFSTGFSMNVAGICEGESRPAESFLAELAGELDAAVLGGVVTRAADGRGRNEAVLIAPGGGELARYTKVHPFSYAGEADHYVPGDGPVVVEVAGAKLSPFICYDLRFPEVFRGATAGGAEVLAVIANWPEARQEHWRTLLRARAIEDQAYVIGVNRTGADPNVAYAGGSVVVDPRGLVVAEAPSEECTIAAELDLEALREYRREFPALDDMKGDWVRARPRRPLPRR